MWLILAWSRLDKLSRNIVAVSFVFIMAFYTMILNKRGPEGIYPMYYLFLSTKFFICQSFVRELLMQWCICTLFCAWHLFWSTYTSPEARIYASVVWSYYVINSCVTTLDLLINIIFAFLVFQPILMVCSARFSEKGFTSWASAENWCARSFVP